MKRLPVILMVLFVAAAILTTLNRKRALEQESIGFRQEKPRKPLFQNQEPDVFYTLDGEAIRYVDIISYPKVILFLWTTNCSLCKDMLVDLNKSCFAYEGTKIVFINLTEPQARVKRFVDYYKLKKCISDKILLDKIGYSAIEFLVSGVPTVIFFEYGTPIYKTYTLNKYLIDKVYEKD